MESRVIFFDIGHTLVTGADQSPRRLLGGRLNLTEKETKRIGKLIMTYPAKDPITLSKAISAHLPRHDPREICDVVSRLWEEQIECVNEIPGATMTLENLKTQGYRLGVISNIWHPFFVGFQLNCARLTELLDFTILSYQIEQKKPALEIYRKAVECSGTLPDHCWMVGDSYELDMEPARRIGYRTLWILCRPERERPLLVELLRGEKPLPDGVVESLGDVLDFFDSNGGSG